MDRSFIPAGSEPGSHVCVDGQLPREPLIYTENMTVGYDVKRLSGISGFLWKQAGF